MNEQSPQCRSCGIPDIIMVLDLGLQPLANNLLRPADLSLQEPRFPLRLFLCPNCWLMQIGDLVPPVDLFSEYLYFSSFSDTMLRHAHQTASQHIQDFNLNSSSLVVEIASNDGYLLKNFNANGIPCLGIEPAANIAKVAQDLGVETLVEFFGWNLGKRLVNEGRQADLVLGNNVFAHAPDTNDFVAGLQTLLKPRGVAALEFPHGLEMLKHNEFDTIYHEHVFYFTLTALVPLFERHGLNIFRAQELPIHGGSLRIYACLEGARPIEDSVRLITAQEADQGISRVETYMAFASRVIQLKEAIQSTVEQMKGQGKSLAAYGASAKGSTLLNYCGLDSHVIDFVVDRSTYKQGRLTPGAHIPILPPEELERQNPDCTLLLTWNFAEEILIQQAGYRARGGKFLIPIPQVRTV